MTGVDGMRAASAPDRIATNGTQSAKQASQNAKIDKSAKEFESLLLSNWLQSAYQSFGSIPGSEDGDDLDSGKEQFQGIAMQSLGSAMSAAGGIGIARMIADFLHKSTTQAESGTGSPPASVPLSEYDSGGEINND